MLYLARQVKAIVSDVQIIDEDNRVERLPASRDASFYESLTSLASVLPVVRPSPIGKHHATAIARLLSQSDENSTATLRALARRFSICGADGPETRLREAMRIAVEAALA